MGESDADFDPDATPSVDWPPWATGSTFTLLPIFRLPVLIHTRSNNAKYLYEIAHKNPLWANPVEAKRLGIATGDLVKVCTEIGYFVLHAWVTEGLTPEVVAVLDHMGRWRLSRDAGSSECRAPAWIDRGAAGTVEDAADHGSGAVRNPGPGHESRLVERRRASIRT